MNYVQDLTCNDEAYIYSADAQGIIDALIKAEENGTPYTTLIINSQSYDGVCFDLQEFLPVVCERAKSIKNIVIDEAWGAWSTFDPQMKEKSAIQNASALSQKHDVNFIVRILFTSLYLHCDKQASSMYLALRIVKLRLLVVTLETIPPLLVILLWLARSSLWIMLTNTQHSTQIG